MLQTLHNSCIEEPNQRVIRADWGCGNWERGLWRLLGKNLGGELLMSAYVLWRDYSTLCWPILAYKAGLALGLWTYEGWHGVLSSSKRAWQDGGETGTGYGGVKKWKWFHMIPMTALLARLAQGRKGFWLSATRGHVDLLVPDAEDKVQAGPQWGQRKYQTEWDEDPALSENGLCVEKRVRPRNECLRGWCWILPSDFFHGTGWPSKAPRFPGINMNLLFRNESMNQHELTWIDMNQYESIWITCIDLYRTSVYITKSPALWRLEGPGSLPQLAALLAWNATKRSRNGQLHVCQGPTAWWKRSSSEGWWGELF